MNRLQSTTIGALVIAVPVIAFQFSQNTKLKQETEELRAAAVRTTSGSGANSDSRRESTAIRRESSGNFSAATLRGLLAQKDPTLRIKSLLDYVNSLAPGQTFEVIEALRKSTPEWDPVAKMLTQVLVARWAQENPDAAYASLASMEYKKFGGEPTTILGALASVDPKRAAAWLAESGAPLAADGKTGHFLSGSIAASWIQTDPDAALAWAASLPDNQRTGAYVGALGSLAATDPKRASTLVANLPADDSRTYAIGEIAKAWARINPDESVTWARSLEGGDRDRSLAQALGAWAETSPAAAAAFVDKNPNTGNTDAYLAPIAGQWASQAPAEAATWLAGQPDGDGKNQAMGIVAWNWTNSDPVAASTWLTAQPAGPARDGAIQGLSKAAAQGDPERALEWSMQISDPRAREQSVRGNLAQWYRTDASAAGKWQEQNFPAETRNQTETPNPNRK